MTKTWNRLTNFLESTDMRILDLMVDELAKGKDMEKILIKERE